MRSLSGTVTVSNLRISHGGVTRSDVDDITAHTAELTWSVEGTVDSLHLTVVSGATVALDTTFASTRSSLPIAGLAQGTAYSYSLTAISTLSQRTCGGAEGSFVTLPIDIGAGWCEDFEGTTAGTMPTGWSSISSQSGDPAVYYQGGTRQLRITSSNGNSALAALPTASGSLAGLVLRLDLQASGTDVEQSLLVAGMMTQRQNGATFVPVDTVRPTEARRTCLLHLERYGGNGRVVALRYVSPTYTRTLYIDNLSLERQQIADLHVDQETNHSLRLNWEGSDTVHVTGVGVDTVVRGSHSLTIDGLAASTGYTYQLTAGTATVPDACHTLTLAGRTLAVPTTAPLCLDVEDYNSATQLPYGWTRPYGSHPQSMTGTRYSGSRALRFYSSGGYATVVSPMAEEASLDGLYLSFYMMNTSGTSRLEVGVMSDPRDTSTFRRLATYGTASTWTRKELALNGTAGAKYIAFRQWASSGSYLYVDNIMLQPCAMPTAYITNPRHNTMEVHWNGGDNGVWIAYGTTASNMTRVHVDPQGNGEHSYELSGLAANTNYTVELWPDCGDASFECHKLTFSQRTLISPIALGYCQEFAGSSLPTGWLPLGGGSVGTTTSTPDGSRALQLTATGGNAAIAVLPGLTPSASCTPPSTVYLDMKRVLTSGSGTLQVGVVSNVADANSFTPLHSLTFGAAPWTWQDTTLAIATAALGDYIALKLVSSNGNATACVDNLCVQYCFVRNVSMVSATPSTVTFRWTDYGSEGVSISWTSSDGGSGSTTAGQSPCTLTGFTPNATYNFHFVAQCPCNQTVTYNAALLPLRFPADTMGLPACMTFDGYANGSYPASWRRLGGSSASYPQVANGGSGQYMDMYTNYLHPLYLVMEPVRGDLGTVVVSGRVMCANNDATTARMQVGTVGDPSDERTFVASGSVAIEALDTWQDFHIPVSPSGGRHPALRFAPGTGSYHLFVDNLSVSTCAAAGLKADGQTLHLSSTGTPSAYVLTITNLQENTTRQRTLGDSVVAYGSIPISPDSTYAISVATYCDDLLAMPCGNVSSTVGYRMGLPYCEGFVNKALTPYGWEVARRSNATYPRIETTSTGAGRYHMQPTAGADNLVVLPQLPVGRTAGGLHVWLNVALGDNSSIGQCRLEIGTYAGGIFTPLATAQNTTLAEHHNITLPASSGTQLALRAVSTSGTRDIFIESLQITDYAQPNGFSIPQTSCHHQHVYWNNIADNAYYLVEWGPEGFSAGSGTMLMSDSCHVMLQPLQPSTRYHLRLSTPDGTPFCNVYHLSSLPPSVTVPYCDNNSHSLTNETLFYLPEVETDVDSLTMRIEWRTATANARLIVGALTNRGAAETFLPIDTLVPQAANTWQTSYVDLGNYTDTGAFIALYVAGSSGNVRQISLQRIPQPTFHVLNSSTVEVSTTQRPVDYYLRVCRHGNSQTAGTLRHITSSPFLVTGLLPYTEYDFYAQADAEGTTCAPSVTHRTHLDIDLPYCTNLSSQPTGWHYDGRFRVMPYALIDSIAHAHLYFTSRGKITVGAMAALDDTASFIALATLNDNAYSAQTLHLNAYSALIGDLHYIAFRYESTNASITSLVAQAVARPTFHVLNSSSVEVSLPEGQERDFYVRVCRRGYAQSSGSIHHATSSPFAITGLSPYTWYDFYTLASPAETTCDDAVSLRTHLDVDLPYCADLATQPAGWYNDGRFRVMPYVLTDSISNTHLYLHSRGRIALGAMAALDDTASFVSLTVLDGDTYEEHEIHLNQYRDQIDSLHYLAFRLESPTAAIGELNLQTVPRGRFRVLSSSEVEVILPEGQETECWIRVCPAGTSQGGGMTYHMTSSPFVIGNLAMYTSYDFYTLASPDETACAQPVTLRTHLDIEPPYCLSLSAGATGWLMVDDYQVMPYIAIDTMSRLWVTLRSRGTLVMGTMAFLSDTASFVPLDTLNDAAWTTHTVDLSAFAALMGSDHYIAFRGGQLQSVTLRTCPMPEATLTAFNEIRFTQPGDEHDYWIRYGDTRIHVTESPFFLSNLDQNTLYNFIYSCDSSDNACLVDTSILTGVQIAAPHCADLTGYRFSGSTLPAGWFTLAEGGRQYAIMPILDLDSLSRLFVRLQYRIGQAGTAIEVGVMDNPADASTFTSLRTFSNISSSLAEAVIPFRNYADTGLYVAFRASGSNVQNAWLNRVELQTVPFVDYLLTSHNTVTVVPVDGVAYPHPVVIRYGNRQTVADSLPWQVGGLTEDATISFNIGDTSGTAPCIATTIVATTHLLTTPACSLDATLSATAPLWRGPELDEADPATLRLRTVVQSSHGANRIVVGLRRVRNVDSTFTPLDTILVGSTSAVTLTATLQRASATSGHFLALRLLPAADNAQAQLSDLYLGPCLTPPSAQLSLLRHNVVEFRCDESEDIEGLWIDYGDGTSQPLTSHTMLFTLANSTTYQFHITCDSAATTCETPLTITTLEAPPALSWCQEFDNGTVGALPANWQATAPILSTQDIRIIASRSHSPSRSLYMNSTLGHGNIAVMPDAGLDSLRGLSLSLWLYTDVAGSRLEVGTIVNPSDPETFSPLHTLVPTQTGQWERFLVDMSDAPLQTFFIALRCDGSYGANRFWIDDLHVSECGSNSAMLTTVDATQVTLRWRQTGAPAVSIDIVPANGVTHTVHLDTVEHNGFREATLTNLTPLTNYRFIFHSSCPGESSDISHCTDTYHDTIRVFTPSGSASCVDPTNFYASYTSCFYGTYGNPTANQGFIDYGYASPLSRHTVHYDLNETDPRTQNLLHTVPEGTAATVRLGNWTFNPSAPEAEQLVYGINVDTLEYDLLILRYAAVLQDPRHAASDQPRFSLEILDENMQLIDPLCGKADFIANYQMGWNLVASTGVLWKDWTTVGIDLSPYAGRTIFVRLTTRDCGEGSHFGYAYFTLNCLRKNITTSGCGVISENELTAPSGFNYRWYTSDNPDDTISSNQTIVVPTNNNVYYFCNLSFVDNPTCSFTMSAFAGTRYPLSLFDYTATLAPCRIDVSFTNRSTISMDGVNPVGTSESVETARWLFGNGDSSSAYHTSTSYYENGVYNVRLITGIADDACLDTLVFPLTIAFPETAVEITGPTERCVNAPADTLRLHNVVNLLGANVEWQLVDSALVGSFWLKEYQYVANPATAGTYSYSASVLDSIGCTLSLNHSLVVHPVYSSSEALHLCSPLFPYAWHDTTLALPSTSFSLQHDSITLHRYSQYGCDSIFSLDLHVYNNADYTPRDTTHGSVCDNLSFFFSDSLLTPDPALTHNLSSSTLHYTDSLQSAIGCDSLSTIVLTVHPTFDHTLLDTVCSNQTYTWGTPQRQMFTSWNANGAFTAAPVDTSWTDHLASLHGCDSLSTLQLHIPPAYHQHHYDTICDAHLMPDTTWQHHSYTYETGTFDTTGTFNFPFSTSLYQCDSLRSLHLQVYPTHHLHLFDTIYDGDLYTFETLTLDTTGLFNALLPTEAFHCDSLRSLHLQRNRRTYVDTVVCQNSLPLTWHASTRFLDGTGLHTHGMQILADSVHLVGADGIDSLLVMTVVVRDTSATVDIVHACDSLVWLHTPDTTYRTSTDAPSILLSQQAPFDTSGLASLPSPIATVHSNPRLHPFSLSTLASPLASLQCDSVHHLDLTVSYTQWTTDYRMACDSILWPDNPLSLTATRRFYADTAGHAGPLGSFSVAGPVDTLLSAAGCDSVVSLDLAVFNATYEESIDTFCFGQTYTWRRFDVGEPLPDSILHTYLTDTLQTHLFSHPHTPLLALTCDSVLAIRLSQMPRPAISLLDTIDCPRQQYRIAARTDVPYTRWSSSPHDPRLDGHRFDTLVDVHPSSATTHYYLYADYHATPLCPYSDTLSLNPVVVPVAEIKVNPEAFTWQQLTYHAYDLTPERPHSIHPDDPPLWQRRWFVDGADQADDSRHIQGSIDPQTGTDSVTLALEVFNGQCLDTATVVVPTLLVSLFAPNIFTPLEATNNRFVIVGNGILDAELFIYNREGLLVFHTDDLNLGWDGRDSGGTLCPQGAYVWRLNYHAVDHPETPVSEVGTVTLIK